jgi:acetyl esterase/lipase
VTVEDVLIEDVPYAIRDGEALLCRIYRSRDTDVPAPAVVDVHPGAWHTGDRTRGRIYDEALARRGFVVVAIDFRQAPRFMHPAGSADVATAVRWARSSSGPLGIDPTRIGLVGSSSGGHLALLAACRPNAPEHGGQPLPWGGEESLHEDIDAAVTCVAALWPPVDPFTRHRFVLEGIEHGPPDRREAYEALRRGEESYFGDEQTMHAASIARIVADGEATHQPAVWICYPELDANVPFAIVETLETAWTQAGGEITVSVYPGELHAFGHRPGPGTDRFVDDLAAFLTKFI